MMNRLGHFLLFLAYYFSLWQHSIGLDSVPIQSEKLVSLAVPSDGPDLEGSGENVEPYSMPLTPPFEYFLSTSTVRPVDYVASETSTLKISTSSSLITKLTLNSMEGRVDRVTKPAITVRITKGPVETQSSGPSDFFPAVLSLPLDILSYHGSSMVPDHAPSAPPDYGPSTDPTPIPEHASSAVPDQAPSAPPDYGPSTDSTLMPDYGQSDPTTPFPISSTSPTSPPPSTAPPSLSNLCYDAYQHCLLTQITRFGQDPIGPYFVDEHYLPQFCKQHEDIVQPCLARILKIEEWEKALEECAEAVQRDWPVSTTAFMIIRASRTWQYMCQLHKLHMHNSTSCFQEKMNQCVLNMELNYIMKCQLPCDNEEIGTSTEISWNAQENNSEYSKAQLNMEKPVFPWDQYFKDKANEDANGVQLVDILRDQEEKESDGINWFTASASRRPTRQAVVCFIVSFVILMIRY